MLAGLPILTWTRNSSDQGIEIETPEELKAINSDFNSQTVTRIHSHSRFETIILDIFE